MTQCDITQFKIITMIVLYYYHVLLVVVVLFVVVVVVVEVVAAADQRSCLSTNTHMQLKLCSCVMYAVRGCVSTTTVHRTGRL